jgi:hypothetical protein
MAGTPEDWLDPLDVQMSSSMPPAGDSPSEPPKEASEEPSTRQDDDEPLDDAGFSPVLKPGHTSAFGDEDPSDAEWRRRAVAERLSASAPAGPVISEIEFPRERSVERDAGVSLSPRSALAQPVAPKRRLPPLVSALMLTVLTAAFVFGAIHLGRQLLVDSVPGDPSAEPGGASTAPAEAPSGAEVPSAAPHPALSPEKAGEEEPDPGAPGGAVIQDLELPKGISVANGKGLLEVDTGDKHSIYVEDVFIGRGPLRSMPVASGEHQVRLSLGGREVEARVRVQAGRRTRFSLEKPAPAP